MLVPNEHQKVKVLKKVRRLFLTKTLDGKERQEVVDPATYYISNIDGFPIKASLGLLEIGRKICMGPQYLNFYFNVEGTISEDKQQAKAVTLNLHQNENKPLVPWEYTVQRLESFGDLDLALWAHRIKNHYENYTKAMANLYDQINSSDPGIQRQITKIRMKTALTRRDIESKYPYNLYTHFLKRDSDQPLSCCFSEKFLKVLGYSPENFIEWSKKNGVPKVLETDNEVYDVVVKELLKQTPMHSESIREGPESESQIYNKEGSKIRVKVRFVNVLDLAPDGIFYYTYIILCDKTSDKKELGLECEEAIDDGVQKKKAIYEVAESDGVEDEGFLEKKNAN